MVNTSCMYNPPKNQNCGKSCPDIWIYRTNFKGVVYGSRAKCAGFTIVYNLETMMKIVEFVDQRVSYVTAVCTEKTGGVSAGKDCVYAKRDIC
jgi:hypothetical protein